MVAGEDCWSRRAGLAQSPPAWQRTSGTERLTFRPKSTWPRYELESELREKNWIDWRTPVVDIAKVEREWRVAVAREEAGAFDVPLHEAEALVWTTIHEQMKGQDQERLIVVAAYPNAVRKGNSRRHRLSARRDGGTQPGPSSRSFADLQLRNGT